MGALALSTLWLAAACSDEPWTPDSSNTTGVLKISPTTGHDVGLRPGQETALMVEYTRAGGGAFAGAQIKFAIFGDPRGSTLSKDTCVTSLGGGAAITVRAGAVTARFQVRATGPGGEFVTFNIEVSSAAFGALRVQPRYVGTLPQLTLSQVKLYLYANLVCEDLNPVSPSNWLRVRNINGLSAAVTFSAIPTNQDHTVFGIAHDSAGKAKASGCAEVPSNVLRSHLVLSMDLHLSDLSPTVQGTYDLKTMLTLPRTAGGTTTWPRPLKDALLPWQDLSDCKNDPVQRMLDCILDALDAADPLDCKVSSPSAKTTALLSERGILSGACRGDTNSRGVASLDYSLWKLMNDSGKSLLSSLAQVETSARKLLATFQIQTLLQVQAASGSGAAAAHHRIVSVTLGNAITGQAVYSASAIGYTHPVAGPLKANLDRWQLALPTHGLSLRFGLLAREAVGQVVLVKGGLPRTSGALLTKLAQQIRTTADSKVLTDCPAIDALACKAARLGKGCLGSACQTGLSALATLLDKGFSQIDVHPGYDLTLQGQVDLVDEDGDLKVDRLGSAATPAAWTARLRMGGEVVEPGEATFTGQRAK